MASPPEEGTSRSTSARHTGSSPPSVACTSVLRSHAATGASASRPEVAKHCAVATTAPARRAASVTSVTSRLFPTPGLPRTSTTPGRPAAADRQAARSTPTSRARPTKGTAPAVAGLRRGRAGEQPAQDGVRGLVRLDPQLTLQDRGAAVVGGERGRPVAEAGLQLHQDAVAGLLQRPQPDPEPGGVQRRGAVTAAGTRRAHQCAHLDAALLELRPRLQHPVVVDARQQVAPVDGECRVGVGEHGLVVPGGVAGRVALPAEHPQVDVHRTAVVPAQIPRRHRRDRAPRPARAAGCAARGAGSSAPARPSSPARTGPRSAGGSAGRRRAR